MNRERYRYYFPQSIPEPDRLERWKLIESYRAADVVRHGKIAVVRRRISACGTHAAGLKIAFVSDLHYHPACGSDRVIDDLDAALAGLSADMLLLGGDAVADADTLSTVWPVLKRLSSHAPVNLAVFGNWERGKGWIADAEWKTRFADAGFTLLCNEFYRSEAVSVYGVDDYNHGPVFQAPPTGGTFNILLSHRPDTVFTFDRAAGFGCYHLALAGHTHGGQLRLPGLGALLPASYYGRSVAYGVFKPRGFETRLMVSSGVGQLSFPWRFGCRREIVLIELEA